MAKRKGRHRKQGGRTTPTGTRPTPRRPGPPPAGGEPEVVRRLRRSVEAGLVATLEAASTFVELGTARPLDTFPGRPDGPVERTDLTELLDTFVEAPFPAMHVLASAMLPMLDDEVLAHRVRRNLSGVPTAAAPDWLDVLERPEPAGAKLMTDPLGDGDNVMIAMSWPGRRAAVAIVYIDHNMGTLVKDAFVVPDTLEAVVDHFVGADARARSRLSDIDPADARARISEAIDKGERTVPPFETDTWPAVRPLIEWWMSLLPEGGRGHEYREWSHDELDELLDRFVASPFATEAGLEPDLVRTLADPLLWFATGTTPGDPLRWSPVTVEIALTSWVPRKVAAPADELRRVPDVMATLVRFAHHERGHAPEDTADTLDAVARWTPDFLEAIEGPPADPARNAARLARIAAGLDPDDVDDTEDFDGLDDLLDWIDGDWVDDVVDDLGVGGQGLLELVERWEAQLLDEIGGPDAAARLDSIPLPEEELDRSGVPDDVRDLVDDVVARIDDVCDARLDGEMRTLCHRYLAELVRVDPAAFRRSRRAELIAAGVVWSAISLQRLPDFERRMLSSLDATGWPEWPTQKELAEAMGANPASVSQRAGSIRRTLEQHTSLTTDGPWHSQRRHWWLSQLAAIADYRDQLDG